MVKRKVEEDESSKSRMDVDGEEDSGDVRTTSEQMHYTDTRQDMSIVDVDLEFNGFNPDVDFLGLKTLLKQLFDVDNELIELSQLADLILSQAEHVGTAVKCDGEESDPYSFITVVNANQHRDHSAIKGLLAYLKSRASTNTQISKALDLPTGTRLGLILSERLINMPHQVVPPMYTMLQKEMAASQDNFSFTHLLVISKAYTELASSLDAEDNRPNKKAKAGKSSETFFFHPEDEVFRKHAITEQGYKYKTESDAGASDSRRAFQEEGFEPQGFAVLLDASKFATIVEALGEYFNSA